MEFLWSRMGASFFCFHWTGSFCWFGDPKFHLHRLPNPPVITADRLWLRSLYSKNVCYIFQLLKQFICSRIFHFYCPQISAVLVFFQIVSADPPNFFVGNPEGGSRPPSRMPGVKNYYISCCFSQTAARQPTGSTPELWELATTEPSQGGRDVVPFDHASQVAETVTV